MIEKPPPTPVPSDGSTVDDRMRAWCTPKQCRAWRNMGRNFVIWVVFVEFLIFLWWGYITKWRSFS